MSKSLISRLSACFFNFVSLFIRSLTRVKQNRIMCTSSVFSRYACNPKYITEYLLKEHSGEYEIYWCFKKGIKVPTLPPQVKTVRWRWSLKYFIVINTSHFIFSNQRLGNNALYLKKRKGQRYIMTWHSSMGVKMIERDVVDMLPAHYEVNAIEDSKRCDLMLSGCKFRTEVIRRAFWYDGQILKKGTPRNDIIFNPDSRLKERLCSQYGIDISRRLLLYAPTFRSDYGLDCYKLDWDDVVGCLNKKTGQEYTVLMRLHPNFYSHPEIIAQLHFSGNVIDVTKYPDIQELLCISDILITDYSSAMFDFGLLYRPCILYATDYAGYDRGTYLQMDDLPFPFAQCEQELLDIINGFNLEEYQKKLRHFNTQVACFYENGHACEAVYNWMQQQNEWK